MHWYTNRSCLICDCPCDRLTNPPCRISGEFIPFSVIKFLHCLDQSEITLLYQIQKQHAAPDIPLGNAHNQTQISLRKPLFGLLISKLHLLCKLNLLVSAKKRHFSDFLEVHPDRVLDADAVWHRKINIFHIHLFIVHKKQVIVRQIIVIIRNAQHIYIVLFKKLENALKLFLLKQHIFEKVVDFLIFQHIFLFLCNRQQLL